MAKKDKNIEAPESTTEETKTKATAGSSPAIQNRDLVEAIYLEASKFDGGFPALVELGIFSTNTVEWLQTRAEEIASGKRGVSPELKLDRVQKAIAEIYENAPVEKGKVVFSEENESKLASLIRERDKLKKEISDANKAKNASKKTETATA